MGKLRKKKVVQFSKKAGLPPGTLVHIGEETAEKVRIRVIDYNQNTVVEKEISELSECVEYKVNENNSWINVDGIHNTKIIENIGAQFGIHGLIQEDILNTLHRPGSELFDDHLFFTLKMMGISKDNESVVSEQVSFILGRNWVISFQEREGDLFEPIRTRLRDDQSLLRKHGVDYLFYRLVDSVVDNYFFVTEFISENIENLEEAIFEGEDMDVQREIQEIRKDLIGIKKSVAPLREAISSLKKEENLLISEQTDRYFKDVHDHIIQVIDMIESQRDLLSGLIDLYMSGISNRMNSVMKVLTIISTIFIPMTFIAGIYGMNFENMPELKWKNGYFFIWGLMLAICIVMLIYFKKKKWL